MFFEGTYYKHQLSSNTLCVIKGRADDGQFLQIIAGDKAYQFDGYAGCLFSDSGIKLDLPDIKGEIRYTGLTPLKSDIMGFFRFFPMQCRHSVISMKHDLDGGIEVDGKYMDFSGGIGYIEGDKGRSFPKKYMWLHCNDFDEDCSIMASVAHIPFLGFCFSGCICAVVYKGKEYRLATYNGVKIKELTKERLVLAQKGLRLEVEISGHDFVPLKMPVKGRMSAIIHECNSACARFKLFEKGKLIFDLKSDNASYEYNF